MVYFTTLRPAAEFAVELKQKYDVLCNPTASHRVRLVTHLDVTSNDIERAITAICNVGSKTN